MSGLREALEKLCEAQGADSYVMVHALRGILAAHPAEPAPSVDREALMRTLAAHDGHATDLWDYANWRKAAEAHYGARVDAVLALINGSAS